MVMQYARPSFGLVNQGAIQVPMASMGAGATGSFSLSSGSNNGASVGAVMAVVLIGLIVLYIATHGIQGSV